MGILSSIRKRGLLGTADLGAAILEELLFDFRHGTDTAGRLGLQSLSIASANRAWVTQYGPTKARGFRRLMKALKLPKESGFVDLGAGKGRVLLEAARYGFRKIVGVEFAKELCQAARNNVSVFQQRTRLVADIRIVECDVVDYPIQADDNIFYLFHPFHEQVLERVLDNVCRSLQEMPRRISIIYNYPAHREVIDRRREFCVFGEFRLGGCGFVVYSSRPSE